MCSQSKATSFLYIVRHGESFGNAVRQIISPKQSTLTENGKLQVKLLGEFLRNKKFTHAFTSDYLRASETAEIILSQNAFSQNILLEQNENLRDKNLGIFEGASYANLFAAIEKSGLAPTDYTPDGGESLADIEGRIESYLEQIFAAVDNRSSEGETILTVSHSSFIVHLFKYLSEKPKTLALKNWNPNNVKSCKNTEYFKLSAQKNPFLNEPRQIGVVVAYGNQHLMEALNDLNKFPTLKLKHKPSKEYKGCVHQ